MPRISHALVRLAMPSGLLAFWCAMAAAAHAYPGGYDWRYQTISVLLYSDQNPHEYLWAWLGLELCAASAIVWASDLRRRLQKADRSGRAATLRLLQGGFACMCLAVFPDRLLPVPKGHEILALAAFLGVCIGMMRQLFLAQKGLGGLPSGAPARRLGAAVHWSVPLVPLVLAGITQAYLALERPEVPWVTPAWRALGIPLFLSFAVWEWVSCAVFSVCLLLLWQAALPPREPAPA
ncbi:MAG TPA: hypothetical protein VMF64_14445 [Steroidobacteraceae bacterium]|nr:hypothetical protein [Steroidobacteraceae bacterium]